MTDKKKGSGGKVLKTIGDILKYMSIFGGLGGLGDPDMMNKLHSVIGGTVGAVAGHLISKAGKKKLEKKIKDHQQSGGGKYMDSHRNYLRKLLSHKKKISIVGLPISKKKKDQILKMLEKIEQHHPQMGKGLKQSGGKWKPFKDIKEFFQGKKKIKPSGILHGLSTVLGFASYIPGLGVLGSLGSLASGVAGSVLKKHGRGLKEIMIDEDNHTAPLSGQTGEGIRIAGSGIKIAGKGANKNGKGVKLSGKGAKKRKYGNRIQVWEGNCECTKGKLYKKDLMKNKLGKIVSKKQHLRGKELYEKYLKNRKKE
jgi:hypothetical protein